MPTSWTNCIAQRSTHWPIGTSARICINSTRGRRRSAGCVHLTTSAYCSRTVFGALHLDIATSQRVCTTTRDPLAPCSSSLPHQRLCWKTTCWSASPVPIPLSSRECDLTTLVADELVQVISPAAEQPRGAKRPAELHAAEITFGSTHGHLFFHSCTSSIGQPPSSRLYSLPSSCTRGHESLHSSSNQRRTYTFTCSHQPLTKSCT